MVTRVWLHGGGGVIEELGEQGLSYSQGLNVRVTHSSMLLCGGCDDRIGSTKQW